MKLPQRGLALQSAAHHMSLASAGQVQQKTQFLDSIWEKSSLQWLIPVLSSPKAS
jgi:hypothetical protein